MDIIQYLTRIILFSTIGVIACIVEETNLFTKIKKITKPLCLISNLPEECVVSLLANFVNPTVGKSMLAGFYKEHKINEKEVIITTLISPLPTILGESIFRVILPLAVAILGFKLGIIYVSFLIISGFLQALFAILYANIFFKKREILISNKNDDKLIFNMDVIIKGFKKSWNILKKIIPTIIIFTFSIDLLIKFGLMDFIGNIFTPIFKILNLPGDAITALIASIIHSSAGYATVAILIKNGILNEKQALIVLLLSNIIVVTMLYIKHSIGIYISLFGRFGLKLALINYIVSISIKILLILLVVLLL